MDEKELDGFYIASITYDNGMNCIAVGIVYGENQAKAREKALNLFRTRDFTSFTLTKLYLDTVKYTATKGGMIVVDKEFYYD